MTAGLEEAALKRAGATIAVADFTDPRIVELIRCKMTDTNSGGP
jgi:hypothetical protein